MKTFFTLISVLLLSGSSLAQTITEKKIFTLKYKGAVDTYNFRYDNKSGNYCYIYTVPDEGKSFIISKKGLSEKYDYVAPEEITFDRSGNYYAVTSDYKADYGTNRYFLISNGNVIKSYDYIEAYSSYINKKNEYVFVFKEKDIYRIGYYSPSSGFRQSDAYDNIRIAFKPNAASDQSEGEMISYKEEDFYHNDKGERAFIATAGGRAKIIFETSEKVTPYSDINESSLTENNSDELSFIAKTGGRFYEVAGNEFVVSGNKEYDKFELTSIPLIFNSSNEPVYIAGDSIGEGKSEYFVVVGNQVQKVFMDVEKTQSAPPFVNINNDIKLNADGSLTYIGIAEEVVPGERINPQDEIYDQYYSRSFLVKDGIANELGYNIYPVKYNDKGDMLYSGMADLKKKEYLLMLNYGVSKIIMNKQNFDEIYGYDFSPTGEVYYVGQMYEDTEKGKTTEALLYLGDKLLGKYYNVIYQGNDNKASILKFNSGNNFSYVAENKLDSMNVSEFVVRDNTRLPFPENISKSKKITYISNLMYSKNDRLFYIADMIIDPVTYDITKEVFVDNRTMGKIYNTVYPVEYDEYTNKINFTASRGKSIYFVTVSF